MKVKIHKSYIKKVLLDPKEPLTHGVYCSPTALHSSYLTLLEAVPRKKCLTCALGSIIRSVLETSKTTFEGATDAILTARHSSSWRELEKQFEGGPDGRQRSGPVTMEDRKKLVAYVENNFSAWTEADLAGCTAAQVKKSRWVQIIDEPPATDY